ncbi:hypothetical protein H1164_08125 [Thermoactinomyces daqus]|uniref:Uncharacterized protein n=1 Tax=Thermoactinomyces daqus TaxID=1329516 RepID=A0A7W2AHL2_9BACL|nr:hypothetical protein [Thermoactinomyces daqus]MBA4542866.1 hypothetical protein [Thermoactinomyces daqus]
MKKHIKGQQVERKGLHHVYGEPADNFNNRWQPMAYTTKEMNEWAIEAKPFVEWAQNETDPQKQKEILEMSVGLNKLMNIYFGYRGEGGKNDVQRLTEKLWYPLPDESIITNNAWKLLKEAILEYDISIGDFKPFYDKKLKKRATSDLNKVKENRAEKQVPVSQLESYKSKNSNDDADQSEFVYGIVEDNYSLEVDDELQYYVKRLLKNIPGRKNAKEKQKFILDFIIKDMVKSQTERKALIERKFPTKEVAENLTEKFGGTFDANKRFVIRFREQAMEELELLGHKLNTTYTNDKKVLKERNMKKFFNKETHEKNKHYSEYLEKFKKGLA